KAVGFVRFDDEVADAKLLDQLHHLLARAGADGEHSNDGSHAEDHAQHGEQRAHLVQQEVLETLAEIGNDLRDANLARERRTRWRGDLRDGAHLPFPVAAFGFSSGLASATSAPSLRPSTITWPSVRFVTFTSRAAKDEPFFK